MLLTKHLQYVRGASPSRQLLLQSLHHGRARHNSNELFLRNVSYPSPAPRHYSKFKFDSNPETSFLERVGRRRKEYQQEQETSKKAAAMPNSVYDDNTPAEVKNAKGLHLLTMNTPNGQAVQIFLEELKDAYGLSWTTTLIDIMTNEQKKDWFLKLDPNGRIPVLVDNAVSPPYAVHETSAEILYLLKHSDKKDIFGFTDDLERNQCLQWMFFWHGSGAPYQGQTNHFSRAAPEKIPYAINRFRNETLRVYGVLEIHLSDKYGTNGEPREYLAGAGKGKYSVADIKTWPWVKGWEKTGFTEEDMKDFTHLKKWIDRIAERPAVQRGIGDDYALKK